jgi:hypothetical protein
VYPKTLFATAIVTMDKNIQGMDVKSPPPPLIFRIINDAGTMNAISKIEYDTLTKNSKTSSCLESSNVEAVNGIVYDR